MRIDLQDRPRRRVLDEVVTDGRAMLYDGAELHRLDELGTALWHFLDGSVTVAELVDDVRSVFPDEPTRVEADVVTFLRSLVQTGLLEMAPVEGGSAPRSS